MAAGGTSQSDEAPPVAVVIVAAGRGWRLGGETPKQYLDLGGQSVLRRTVAGFLDLARIGPVQVVIHPDDRALYDTAMEGLTDPRVLPPVTGGATRADTTAKGLAALQPYAPRHVLIHDAARPFVTGAVIDRVIGALADADGAFAGLPVVDALWQTADGAALAPVPRDGVWRAQTPQGFRFDAILAAHTRGPAEASDDVAVARAAGLEVRAVMGSEENFKITVAQDMDRARQMLRQRGKPQT